MTPAADVTQATGVGAYGDVMHSEWSRSGRRVLGLLKP